MWVDHSPSDLKVITESRLQVVDHNGSGVRSNSKTTFLVYNLDRLVILYMKVYVMYVYLGLMDRYEIFQQTPKMNCVHLCVIFFVEHLIAQNYTIRIIRFAPAQLNRCLILNTSSEISWMAWSCRWKNVHGMTPLVSVYIILHMETK